MAVGAFPVFKLGALAIRQISKPISKIIMDKAKTIPFFRKYVCLPPAHLYNWMDVKYKMWIMDLGRPTRIPQLTEPMAIELGANLIGEFIIFIIGASVLLFEYVRSAKKEAKKEFEVKQTIMEMSLTMSELAFQIERQDAHIREITRVLAELDSRSIFKFQKTDLGTLPLDETCIPKMEELKYNTSPYDPNHCYIFAALNYIETQVL